MLKRRIEIKLESLKKGKKALLITGARQVGKSYIIRQFGKANYSSFVEINLLTDTKAITLLKKATTTDEVLVSLSALTKVPLKKGETLFFIDEVQELFLIYISDFSSDSRNDRHRYTVACHFIEVTVCMDAGGSLIELFVGEALQAPDRKSTRLNSSHL